MYIYIETIADKEVVEDVKNRLEKIDTPKVFSIGQIEDYLEDSGLDSFPTIPVHGKDGPCCCEFIGRENCYFHRRRSFSAHCTGYFFFVLRITRRL